MNYPFLLLDADDTLLDFKKNEQIAFCLLCKKLNYPLTEAVFCLYKEINQHLWRQFEAGQITKEEVVNTRFQELFSRLGVDLKDFQPEPFYQKLLGKGAFLTEGAYELCQTLSQTHQLYIVTNGVASTQYSRLRTSGLHSFVKAVFVSEEIGFPKPSSEFFTRVFQQIPDFLQEKALIIGDSLTSDIQGGKNSGIATCWYNPKNLKNTSPLIPDYEIDRLDKLYAIVS